MKSLCSLSLLVLAAACGLPSPEAEAPPPSDAVESATAQELSVPSNLVCVSAPMVNRPAGEPISVLRLDATLQQGVASLQVRRGAQFPSRADGTVAADVDLGQRITYVQAVNDDLTLEGWTTRLVLKRQALFFTGTFTAFTDGSDHAMTCWNPSEVFGSPWGGSRGAFQAQYDWSGRCVDALGNDALNALPIEFVRETGRGECADLRGAALNDHDLSQPQLSGWDLMGANLAGARLSFADLVGAQLHGAKVDQVLLGYASLSGATDVFTTLPALCKTTSSPWGGSHAECAN